MAYGGALRQPQGTEEIAVDVLGGRSYQRVKWVIGGEGEAIAIPGDAANGVDVDVTRLPALPAGTNNIGDVDLASPLPAGTNNIGDVDVLTLPALPPGTNNIGDVDVLSMPAVDTELPAAAVPTDTDADTAVPDVGQRGKLFGGTTWERRRSVKAVADGADGTGSAAVGHQLYNGATWDRQRGNIQATALASAARGSATTSTAQVNHNARGILAELDVSVASGTGGLTLNISGVPAAGTASRLFRAAAAVIATGTYYYELYPGIGTALPPAGGTRITERMSGGLPRQFLVEVSVGDASSYTYSVSYTLIV